MGRSRYAAFGGMQTLYGSVPKYRNYYRCDIIKYFGGLGIYIYMQIAIPPAVIEQVIYRAAMS